MNELTKTTTEKATIERDFAPHRRVSIRICKDCGKTYVITDNDVVHYVTKFNTLPLRCEDCRDKKRKKFPE